MKKEIRLAKRLDARIQKQKNKLYTLRVKTAKKFFNELNMKCIQNTLPFKEGGFVDRDKYLIYENGVVVADLHMGAYCLIVEENEELKRKCEHLFFVKELTDDNIKL